MIGLGPAGDGQTDAARAKLGRLLHDRLQPVALDQGDYEVEVGTQGLGLHLAFGGQAAAALGYSAHLEQPFPVAPVEEQQAVAELQAHHRQQVAALLVGGLDVGAVGQGLRDEKSDHGVVGLKSMSRLGLQLGGNVIR